jgi:hypothetical protein
MPLARPVRHFMLALLGCAAAACASAPEAPAGAVSESAAVGDPLASTARMPRDIQLGAVGMAIQRVEQDVSRAEIAGVIGPMIANAPVCLRWPTLWIEASRRNTFVVRYDLMMRDWGQPATEANHARMQEFVEMGFLQEQEGSNPQVVTYALTNAGLSYLTGVIEPGRRPSFCAPTERRLVAVSALEWGEFPCGTLRVSFTHDGEAWPSWARSETTRARFAAASWPAANVALDGSVSLSRQWFRRQDLPPGAENGVLRSACYDARRQEITGDDLDLSLPAVD